MAEAALHSAAPALLLLLGCRSKETLSRLLQDAFDCRFQGGWTRDRRRRVRQELSLPEEGDVDAVSRTAVLRAAPCRL